MSVLAFVAAAGPGIMDQYGAQIITAAGAIGGTLALAFTTRYLDRNKSQLTEDREMRNELRLEADRKTEEIVDLRAQVLQAVADKQAVERMYIEYREKYITIFEKYHTLRSEYERVTGHKIGDNLPPTPE